MSRRHRRRWIPVTARIIILTVLATIAVRILIAHEDAQTAQRLDEQRQPTPTYVTQRLSPAERQATADCVPIAAYKARHDDYPPPWLVVKPDDGGPARVLPFDAGYRAAEAGRVWVRRGCATHPERNPR